MRDKLGARLAGLLSVLAARATLLTALLNAQVPAVRFDHLSVEDGLSHSAVLALAQDRRGFLWLGTNNGLNRYDGMGFRVFRHDPQDPASLAESTITRLLVDRDGALWVATPSGLHLFDAEQERFLRFRHDPDDPTSLSSDGIDTLFEDRKGTLWLGTTQGLDRREPDGTFRRFRHDPGAPDSLGEPPVLAVNEDTGGTLWVGTYGGLYALDRESETFRGYRHVPGRSASLSNDLVNAIEIGEDGTLWIGTAQGLNLFDPATEIFTPYRRGDVDLSAERIFELFRDRRGDLWVGTLNAGLIRIPVDGGEPIQYRHDASDPWSLNGDRIHSIFEDSGGILWAGTWVGANRYDRRREQFAIYRREPARESTLTTSNISAIVEDRGGALWAGTWDRGLNRVDREGQSVDAYLPIPGNPRSLPDDTITDLLLDEGGVLWVATWGGLALLDTDPPSGPGELTVYRHDPEDPGSLDDDAVGCLYQDRRQRLWVGTIRGLSRFDGATGDFVRHRPPGVPEHSVSRILQDRDGSLWYGSGSQGLFQLPRLDEVVAAEGREGELEVIQHLHDPEDPGSLSGNDVNYLFEDRQGNLWVGMNGTGLDKLALSRRRFDHYRERDGLASNQVLGILEDDAGHLWLSTSRGLSRFDSRSENFRNYGVEDGLQSEVFSYRSAYRSPGGEMFFGGIHGFNAFFPERIADDPFVPPVVLTDFQLFNESLAPRVVDPESPLETSIVGAGEIRLSHRQDVFSIEFAALHYAAPDKNRYAYRLDSFDDDWTETGASERSATYTNLDAGAYTFRVRGANPSGVWNPREATVRIVVAPPPWESWWAYTLYGLALAAIVSFAVRAQRRKLARERFARRKELEQERQVNARLRAVDKLKDEFLANTSHELRTPLYGMTGLAESLIDGAAGELPASAKANLAMIVASGRRLTTLVNDILDFSKLRHKSLELDRRPVDLRSLAEVVLTLLLPLVGSKRLELRNSVPADLPAADADENRLEQILHNLVGNAVKFTEAGTVEVGAEVDGPLLTVRVSDTGVGIPEDRQQKIFEAFEQADASTEREFGGTGLGLAVTRRLVELHGGTITVESSPGEGSTFSFTLPVSSGVLADRPATRLEPATSRAAEMAGLSPELDALAAEVELQPATSAELDALAEGSRILVVDDEPVNLQVLRNYLSIEHFELTLASSGEEALRLLDEQSFDLVLLDVMMPKMSGFEVCRALREKHSLQELPVLFLTAKSQADDVVAGMSQGANDFLTKPISRGELLARVRPHLDLLHVHRQLEELVEEKSSQVKVLSGLLPICASCKKIRSDEGDWSDFELFINRHSEAQFSHGLCPDCVEDYYRSREGGRPGG